MKKPKVKSIEDIFKFIICGVISLNRKRRKKRKL